MKYLTDHSWEPTDGDFVNQLFGQNDLFEQPQQQQTAAINGHRPLSQHITVLTNTILQLKKNMTAATCRTNLWKYLGVLRLQDASPPPPLTLGNEHAHWFTHACVFCGCGARRQILCSMLEDTILSILV